MLFGVGATDVITYASVSLLLFGVALLVAEGYAQQLTIPPNVTYAGLFRRLVVEARLSNRGLWAEEGQKPAGT